MNHNQPLPLWLCIVVVGSIGGIFWYGVVHLIKALL